MIPIHTGLDVLVAENFKRLYGLKIAILANQASVDKNLNHIMHLTKELNIVKLFAPEHGFFGTCQDMETVNHNHHKKHNIPIISLYGDHKESLRINAHHLSGVDILLCDLQDIGSRYYTFHCTIAWAMAACAQAQVKLMVIDRPNIINAHNLEGNIIKKPQFSFVGAYPILNRHGFTMGEILHYVKDILNIKVDLEVIWMPYYDRKLYFDELNLPFVFPSPNMPTVNTAVVYPGMCLIEGTNMSEGRGTCTPFQLVGSPFIDDADKFKEYIDSFELKGVITRATSFKPMFHKHAQENCLGVFIHVTDRNLFKPLRFAIATIMAAQKFKGFTWRQEPYEFENDRLAIDLLLGDDNIRLMLEKNAPFKEICDLYDHEEKHFATIRTPYLHY